MPPATGMLQLLYLFSVFKTAADASEKGYILANVENILNSARIQLMTETGHHLGCM